MSKYAIGVIGIVLLGCGEAPEEAVTTATEALEQSDRPANVPSDYIFTPGGWTHTSCIHEVPNGATVDAERGDVMVDDKLIAHYAPCAHKAIPSTRRMSGFASLGGPAAFGGWVEYTGQTAPAGAGQWGLVQNVLAVPPAPTQSGATNYFFPGLQSNVDANCGILQPVLQWGASPAGGGSFWSIGAWWWSNSNQFHSALSTVQVGDSLQMTMAHLANGWFVLANDRTRAASRSITVNTACRFDQAYPAVFEIDAANPFSNCNQVPTGAANFTNMALGTGVGTFTGVAYAPFSAIGVPATGPQCGWAVNSVATATSLRL